MVHTRVYNAHTSEESPLIIGLPGFVHREETTRIDQFLTKIANYGIHGARITYSQIEVKDNGKTISCAFKLENYAQDLQNAIEALPKQLNIDKRRIGLIASSIGALIFAYYQNQKKQDSPTPCCIISLSPFLGWPYLANKQKKEEVGANSQDILIPNPFDHLNGVRRFIPKEYFSHVINTDGLMFLGTYKQDSVPALTILGKKDEISSPEAMRNYHRILSSSLEDLLEYDTGHDVPALLWEKEALEFLTKTLKKTYQTFQELQAFLEETERQ